MGTNCSKTLKRRFESQDFLASNSPNDSGLTDLTAIEFAGENNKTFHCLVKELDTQKYTQTLSKVDEFLEKMNKTSPYISSFFFISESKTKANYFRLVFEYGKSGLTYFSILDRFTLAMNCLISALDFLDSINLFHPRVDLRSLVSLNKNDSTLKNSFGLDYKFKMINQFCYSEFLDFITNIYLSSNKTSLEIKSILLSKKIMNFKDIQRIVSETIKYNPKILDPAHRLSNLVHFQTYLTRLNPKNFSYSQIKYKFKELFNIIKNSNINYREVRDPQENFEIRASGGSLWTSNYKKKLISKKPEVQISK